MLGGIKGDRKPIGAPLFRVFARRWKPVVPLRRRRVELTSMMPEDEPHEPSRSWITKPRRLPVVVPDPAKNEKPSWNRWLWMK